MNFMAFILLLKNSIRFSIFTYLIFRTAFNNSYTHRVTDFPWVGTLPPLPIHLSLTSVIYSRFLYFQQCHLFFIVRTCLSIFSPFLRSILIYSFLKIRNSLIFCIFGRTCKVFGGLRGHRKLKMGTVL